MKTKKSKKNYMVYSDRKFLLFFTWKMGTKLRLEGAPIPVAVFQLEGPPGEERWTDFVSPNPFFFGCVNVFLTVCSAICLVGIIFIFWRIGTKKKIRDHQTVPQNENP